MQGRRLEAQESRLLSRGVGTASPPSLVSKSLNSAKAVDPYRLMRQCPNPKWTRGVCDTHGNIRHYERPCSRRDCDVCGPQGRLGIAQRIAWGVRLFGARNCAWITLTFDTEMAEESWWKPRATRRVANFVRWLRQKRGMPGLTYSITYELTKRGRLHINLIVGGHTINNGKWKYVPQKLLQERWGARVWVSRVIDTSEFSLGVEVAKAYSPEGLASYLSKLEQAVPAEWGRRVSFSKGWPQLPSEVNELVGVIHWSPITDADGWGERRDRGGAELRPGVWAVGSVKPHCDCFTPVKIMLEQQQRWEERRQKRRGWVTGTDAVSVP